MAGPMVGPLLQRLGLDLITAYWEPDGNFPDHEPNPLLPEKPGVHHARGRRPQGRSGDRVGRRRGSLLLHRRHGVVRGRRLPHRAARGIDAAQAARRDDPVRRPRQPRGRGHGAARRRPCADEPRRPCLLQDPDAPGGRSVRRRGVRSLLLPRLLLRRLGHDPSAIDPRAAQHPPGAHVRAAGRRFAPGTSSQARSTPRSSTSRRRSKRSRSATPTPHSTAWTASRSTTTTGTSTCAHRIPSRCCDCAWSRFARARTWKAGATRCSP